MKAGKVQVRVCSGAIVTHEWGLNAVGHGFITAKAALGKGK